MANLPDVQAALFTALSTSSGVEEASPNGVWNGAAGQGTAFPYTVYQLVSEVRMIGTRGSPDIIRYRFLVKGITDSDDSDLAASIDTACGAALHKAALPIDGFIRCLRRGGFPQTPDPDGGWHVGSYYEIEVEG